MTTPKQNNEMIKTLPIEEIKKLYQDGKSTTTIAEIFDVDPKTIHRRLVAEGIPRRKSKELITERERIRRFWLKVDKNGQTPPPNHEWTAEQKLPDTWQWDGEKWVWVAGPCWVWTAFINGSGYGMFNDGGETILAHHFSYSLEHGEIGGGEVFGDEPSRILHACDNPPCVRPSHLSQGTQADNIADMVSKNRNFAKLDHSKAAEIRVLYATGEWSQRDLANKFDVGQARISDVILKKRWWLEK